MNGLEIALLISGAIVFVISFLLPVRENEECKKQVKEIGEEEIKQMIELKMKDVNSKVDDVVEETIEYAIEKTERAFDRITNEKMSAISEYSDTVMEEIHKNHQEVIFLYDMLNEKHETLKSTVAQVDMAAKRVRLNKEDVKQSNEQIINSETEQISKTEQVDKTKQVKKSSQIAKSESEETNLTARPFEPERISRNEVTTAKAKQKEKMMERKNGKKGSPTNLQFGPFMVKAISEEETKEVIPIAAVPDSYHSMRKVNRNEEILAMFRLGKDTVTIAKELGMGIGEVKLVLDLYKGSAENR